MSSIDSSFGVDYAITEKSWCKECKQPIPKNQLRMSVRAPSDVHGGAEDNWFHFHCFWDSAAKDEQIYERDIYRIELLKWNDQEKIRQKIAESKDLLNSSDSSSSKFQLKSEGANKKRKSLEAVSIPKKKQKVDNLSSDLQTKLKKQTNTYCNIRDELTETLSVEEAIQFLKANDRFKRKNDGDREVFEQLTDCIVFGVPDRCRKCPGGVLFYCPSQHTYRCYGKASAYASCQYRDRNPPRISLKVPSGFDRNELFFELPVSFMIQERCYSPGLDFVGMITPVSSPLIEKCKKRLSLPESVEKPFVKNGCTIDGRAYFARYSSVFTDTDGTLYQAYLGFSDISRNLNNFYKLQLLKHDKKEEYYLYRSWGRIGTPGGLKLECFNKDIDRALKEFKRIFFEKTGNLWENRKTFVKHPCLHDIVEIEVVEKDCNKFQSFDVNTSKSKLPVPIKKLIGNLFDIEIMKESLIAMNVDLQKMPLGKISKFNIMKAMFILKQLESDIRDSASSISILELSNQFYTLIPHACVSQAPSLLDNDKIIHEKTQLLIDLFQIEIAFSFIDDNDSQNDEKEVDPIDKYYEKLHCKVEVLPTDTPEFEIIQSYLFQNHAPTHTEYSLEIIEVFKIEREGEETRFKRNIGNRNLLWHGSKTSNFAGILSQGLRIAPPEAPANGYMFGKGIYFADMVSKSANYCGITDGEGYLLLSEVALGQTQEERHSDDQIKKPSKGKSSVKGLGQIVPNKLQHRVTKDGINVPIGVPIVRKNGFRNYPLFYNEYIVYDEAQVKMKYLIKAKFNSK